MPERWNAYWRSCLEDSGVAGLDPVAPGSWFVALDQFCHRDVLQRVLAVLLRDIDPSDLDTAGPLSGGDGLVADDRRLEPGCCGDLSDLRAWFDALDHTGSDWRQVWIGHPWTHVRERGGDLEFAVPSEDDSPLAYEPPLTISRADLREALSVAENHVRDFRAKVLDVLGALVSDDRLAPLATILVEGRP